MILLTTMPIFIVFNLALCFIVQNASSIQTYLLKPILIYIGLSFAIISFFGIMIKKLSIINWYDVFSSSALILWLAYWKPLFTDDSPIFFYYPLYFAMMTAFVSLFFISQRDKIDDQSLHFMQNFSKKRFVHPSVMMLCVLISLQFHENFMLYPTLMTLLILRFALEKVLKTN
ncbi:MAG: hypothetical protein RIQ94_533 [Pseudomonadota bacterium]